MSTLLPTVEHSMEVEQRTSPWVQRALAAAGLVGVALIMASMAAPVATTGLWTAVKTVPQTGTATLKALAPSVGGRPQTVAAQSMAAAQVSAGTASVPRVDIETRQASASPTAILALPLLVVAAAVLACRKAWAAYHPATPVPLAMLATTSRKPLNGKKMLVLGGSGYVGAKVCEDAVAAGWSVTALSRRGAPEKLTGNLSEVEWRQGDATDAATLQGLVAEGYDGIVHAIGLLFDSQSGLVQFNTIVSGSRSLPSDTATYDSITRQTAEDLLDAVLASTPKNKQLPIAFVSAAEAGWPEVQGGDTMDNIAPDWLKRYLAAKRTVEARLTADTDGKIRPLIYRPSLMWDWSKLDVLPAIPAFWIANKVGVPFVDRPIRVETIAKAIVSGIADETVSGVQRFPQMDELAARSEWEF